METEDPTRIARRILKAVPPASEAAAWPLRQPGPGPLRYLQNIQQFTYIQGQEMEDLNPTLQGMVVRYSDDITWTR